MPRPQLKPRLLWPGLACLVLESLLLSVTVAGPPVLKSVFPAGCQAGESTEVVLTGDDLKEATRLVFSRKGLSAERLENGSFRVQAAAATVAGPVDDAVQTKFGLSGSLRFMVSAQPEILEQEPNDDLAAVESESPPAWPVIINGQLTKADVDWHPFAGKQGQLVFIRCRSRSIDGSVTAALTLAHADGRELVHSPNFRPEPFMTAVLPEDGLYAVRVVDRAYEANPRSIYRLEITTGPQVIDVFPHVVQAGQATTVTVTGFQLPGGTPAATTLTPGPVSGLSPLQQLTVPVTAPAAGAADGGGWTSLPALLSPAFAFPLEGIPGWHRLQLSTEKPLVETETKNDSPETADKLAIPGTMIGQFQKPGDLDWLEFTAKKGEKLAVRSSADRFGEPIDLDVTITDTKGKVLASLKDVALPKDWPKPLTFTSLDAADEWAVPADGTYRMLVRDLYGGSIAGPGRNWQLTVGTVKPSFQAVALPGDGKNPLSLTPGATTAPKNLYATVTVHLARIGGFDGPVTVSAVDLPDGLTAADVEIAKGKSSGELKLEVAENFAPGTSGVLRFSASAVIGEATVEVPVRTAMLLPDGAPATLRFTDGMLFAGLPAEPKPAAGESADGKPADKDQGKDDDKAK
ncbi:MAG: hypothetical protein KDA79_15050 [Planctomycetaceae bacterium]|nr:hypothetical protein [Planctomycetaceae bacterium]